MVRASYTEHTSSKTGWTFAPAYSGKNYITVTYFGIMFGPIKRRRDKWVHHG